MLQQECFAATCTITCTECAWYVCVQARGYTFLREPSCQPPYALYMGMLMSSSNAGMSNTPYSAPAVPEVFQEAHGRAQAASVAPAPAYPGATINLPSTTPDSHEVADYPPPASLTMGEGHQSKYNVLFLKAPVSEEGQQQQKLTTKRTPKKTNDSLPSNTPNKRGKQLAVSGSPAPLVQPLSNIINSPRCSTRVKLPPKAHVYYAALSSSISDFE